ncbi:MAG: hypothetical protein NT027_03765 [Proteobacteria bacterium]|nr:hypothetical protein [Pseudomonadota bacterium]
MTPSKETSNDFRLSLSVRIEARNCRAILVQSLSVLVGLAALAMRVATWFQHSVP